MNSRKKKNRIMLLLILLLCISIGFAYLSTTLNVGIFANINKNAWNVYLDGESIVVNPNSTSDELPTVRNISSSLSIISWNAILDVPGDFYEFTVDAVNSGAKDAMITNIEEGIPDNLPDYITYTVTYVDGSAPEENDLLPKATVSGNTTTPSKQKYKIRVEFIDDITREEFNSLPSGGINLEFSYKVKYDHADENAHLPGE